MEDRDVISNVKDILNNPNYCPCLLLGKYVTEFKKQYKGKIFMVSTLEDVRYITSNYSGIMDLEGRYFVMDGIGFLSETGQNSLLKFIEESKFPIVLLSYYDKVSPIIMSRMKFIFKKSSVKVDNLKFMKVNDCLNELERKEKEEEVTELDRIKYYSDNCPLAYYLEKRVPLYTQNARRINKIISRL